MNAKRILLTVLLLVGLMASAMAEEMPSEAIVLEAMQTGESGGWRIPEVSGFEPGAFLLEADGSPYLAVNETDSGALAVLQKGGRNVLCLLQRDGSGKLQLRAQNANMLYQGADAPIPYVYCEIPDQFELYFHHAADGKAAREYYFLSRELDGWRVTSYYDERTDMNVFLRRKLMTFTDERYELSYTVRTEYEARFADFNLEAFRQAAEHAHGLLPQDAAASWEDYILPDQTEGEFAKNQRFEVYSAPSEDAYRAAKGKAVVSTNGGIEVYGETQGWLMIQYEVSMDQRRIGYITADALPMDTPVRSLRFAYQPAKLMTSAVLTDDPFWSRNELKKLSADEEVTLLAMVADWVYVEAVMPDGRAVRGFIPASAVTTSLANG